MRVTTGAEGCACSRVVAPGARLPAAAAVWTPFAVFAVTSLWIFRSSLAWPGDNPVLRAVVAMEAWVDRARFSWVVLFCAIWGLLVYAPVAHWVWGGGWLASMGVLDFAGGLVVHTTAGASALVIAVLLGKRQGFPKSALLPHAPGLTMLGAVLLWVGWFGFNGGSALAANDDAAAAIINAVWDLLGKHHGKPVWQLVADMAPAELLAALDLRHITDAVHGATARLGDVGPIAFRDVALVLPRSAVNARRSPSVSVRLPAPSSPSITMSTAAA